MYFKAHVYFCNSYFRFLFGVCISTLLMCEQIRNAFDFTFERDHIVNSLWLVTMGAVEVWACSLVDFLKFLRYKI